jgi:hypothetical protein
MDSQERQLISGLFDRMRGVGAIQKDADAEALINQQVRQIPDSAYLLVQSVLVQEHALQQADQRIRELEERVQSLESQAQRAPANGGFLGGLFGGGRQSAPPATASRQSAGFGGVPAAGARPMAGGSPWGAQPAQPAAGGSFMRSAMATAAGVAGGMLLADGIRNMMSGGAGAGQASAANAGDTTAASDNAAADLPAYDDATASDADYGGDIAGDMGGGDFEI